MLGSRLSRVQTHPDRWGAFHRDRDAPGVPTDRRAGQGQPRNTPAHSPAAAVAADPVPAFIENAAQETCGAPKDGSQFGGDAPLHTTSSDSPESRSRTRLKLSRSSRVPRSMSVYAYDMSALLPATARQRDRALECLLSRGLDPIVDMVGWSRADGAYEVASADGAVQFRRDAGAMAASGSSRSRVRTRSPCRTRPRFVGLEAERALPHPSRNQNSYPNAFEQFAQLFDHPSAPDLCVIHSCVAQLGRPGRAPRGAWIAGRRTGEGTLHRRRRRGAEARDGRHRLPTDRRGADDAAAARGRS